MSDPRDAAPPPDTPAAGAAGVSGVAPGTGPVLPLPADLLQHVTDGIVVIDRGWRYVYVNPKAGDMLGRDPASLTGRDYREEFPEALDQPFFHAYERAMAGGESAVFEAHYAPWDRWFENRIYPGPHGITILFTEVTERNRARRAHEQSRLHIDAISAAIPVLIWTWDFATGDVWRSGALLQHLGYAEDALPVNGAGHAEWWFDHLHPDERAAETARSESVRRAEAERSQAEYRFRRADGSYATLATDLRVLRDEHGAPARAVGVVIDVSARAEAARERQASEERYALAARAANAAIYDWNLVSGTLLWNAGMDSLFCYAPGDVAPTIEWWSANVHPDDAERTFASLHAVVDAPGGGHEWRDAYRFRRGDGRYADVVERGYVVRDAEGRAVRMIGAMEDVTAQRELEARLRQAQKMEAVGQLAGGIAHDFNNLLTVITGNLELVRGTLDATHAALPDLEQIGLAAGRARALVRQLLTFSRKQPVRPRLVRVGELVRGTERLLRRLIGEEIVLRVSAADEASAVFADPGQLEQVLVNLAVNARDAMLTPLHGHPGTGGVLGIDVDEVAAPAGAEGGVPPGRYVRLRVRDTGHGMDEATRARVFEPFFTTKEVGAGTGLGLATVFGVVEQAGGSVTIDSAPGRGTEFTILLPDARAAAGVHRDAASDHPPAGAETSAEAPPGGAAGGGAPDAAGATVLLVEDEALVRSTARRMLERHGYRVLEAQDGADGLRVWGARRDEVDALVSDVRMPEMDGITLATRLRAERPELPVVLMSGYPSGSAPEGRLPPASAVLLDKPFTAESLTGALRRALAAAGPR